MVSGGWVGHIRSAEPAIAASMLQPPSVILGAVPGHTRSIKAFDWPSYKWFSNEVLGRGQWAHGGATQWLKPFTTVMYDPEAWTDTPEAEQRDPIGYIEQFASLGHARGWTVIVSPEPSLMTVTGAGCGVRGSETIQSAFLRCNIAGDAARSADVVDIQAQRLEFDPVAYRAFVAQAAAQAKAANPNVKILAEISTGTSFSASQMYAAWASVRDIVDGYYLSITGDDKVGIALAFLRMLPWTNVPSS